MTLALFNGVFAPAAILSALLAAGTIPTSHEQAQAQINPPHLAMDGTDHGAASHD
jgi:hypothetical protein